MGPEPENEPEPVEPQEPAEPRWAVEPVVAGGWVTQDVADYQAKWNEICQTATFSAEGYEAEDLATFGQPVKVSTQVVAGVNYAFEFADGTKVIVLEQTWMNVLDVTNVFEGEEMEPEKRKKEKKKAKEPKKEKPKKGKEPMRPEESKMPADPMKKDYKPVLKMTQPQEQAETTATIPDVVKIAMVVIGGLLAGLLTGLLVRTCTMKRERSLDDVYM